MLFRKECRKNLEDYKITINSHICYAISNLLTSKLMKFNKKYTKINIQRKLYVTITSIDRL